MIKADLIDGDAFEELAHRLGLFYVETHEVAGKLDEISRSGPVVVLSHNSDGNIVAPGTPTREYDFVWQDIPPNVRHWFGQNVDVDDPRLTPIPIGLERDRWYPELRKKAVILGTTRSLHRNLLYLNANTKIVAQREELYQRFESLPWVTAERGHNGLNFEHYARQLASHKFVLCPDGNGYDTHRTWEALYLGAIPIVENHYFTNYFACIIPLVVVVDWSEITKEHLEWCYDLFQTSDPHHHKLKFSYWEQLIRKYL